VFSHLQVWFREPSGDEEYEGVPTEVPGVDDVVQEGARRCPGEGEPVK
jgi:hypothetical protein